jgi:hypothetical protein
LATVNDIITDAYGEIGVYGPSDTLSATDTAFALRRLNLILDTWAAQPLMSTSMQSYDIPVTAGVTTYTIGPSGVPVTGVRPTRIRAARLSYPNSNPLFYPLNILDILQFEELQANRYYDVGRTMPDTVVFNNTMPNSTVQIWPMPDLACTVTVWFDSQPAPFASTGDTVSLSQGYYKALMLQLALELAPSFGAPISPVTQAAWQDAVRVVKAMNTVVQGTPYDERAPGFRGRFDIRSGLTYGS